MSASTKIFISTDIETDGPQIGRNSMRSFACEALDPTTKKVISRFSANLKPLSNATDELIRRLEWAEARCINYQKLL